MSRRFLLLAGLMVVGLGTSCTPRPELDFLSPRVLSVDPNSSIVPVDVDFTIRFSEPLNPNTVNGLAQPYDPQTDPGASVVLVEREALSDAFLNDLASDGITLESRFDDLIPAEVTLSGDDDVITLTTTAELARGTAYTLALSSDIRDANGNPLVDGTGTKANFLFHVETDDGPPAVIANDVPAGALVPRNRERFTVVFDQPVLGLDRDSLRVVGPNAPSAEGVEITPDRLSATLILEDNALACERFPGNTDFALEVGPGVTDDDGNEAAPLSLPFTTGPVCDEVPVRITSGPFPTAGEVNATVAWTTDEPSTTELRFGVFGGALDCLGLPCPVLGTPATDDDGGRFAHSVEVSGLDVDALYAFEVRSIDLEGFAVSAAGEFLTAQLPDVSINEIMANSPSFVDDDAQGEYIELANYGDTEIDINGWAVRIDDDDPCPVPEGASVVPAGGYLLLVRADFLVDAYGLSDDNVVRFGSTFCGKSLVNVGPDQVILLDDDGRPISSYSGFLALPSSADEAGIERIAPDAPDVSASYCRSPGGGTPAAANAALVSGCAQ